MVFLLNAINTVYKPVTCWYFGSYHALFHLAGKVSMLRISTRLVNLCAMKELELHELFEPFQADWGKKK